MEDSAKNSERNDFNELQREHFREITFLEQSYRKKILEMEEVIA